IHLSPDGGEGGRHSLRESGISAGAFAPFFSTKQSLWCTALNGLPWALSPPVVYRTTLSVGDGSALNRTIAPSRNGDVSRQRTNSRVSGDPRREWQLSSLRAACGQLQTASVHGRRLVHLCRPLGRR